MTIRLDTPAEAFAAIAGLVVGADTRGTAAERDYLFAEVGKLSVFDGLDDAAFRALLAEMTARVVDQLPTEDVRVTAAGVDELARVARNRLTPEQRLQALGMARSLAGADRTEPAEFDLLERLRIGLDG